MKNQTILTPGHVELSFRMAANLKMFLAVRGHDSLFGYPTVAVLRDDFSLFVSPDLAHVDDPDSVIALTFLRNLASYEQSKTLLADAKLRHSSHGNVAIVQLSDQICGELLQQAKCWLELEKASMKPAIGPTAAVPTGTR